MIYLIFDSINKIVCFDEIRDYSIIIPLTSYISDETIINILKSNFVIDDKITFILYGKLSTMYTKEPKDFEIKFNLTIEEFIDLFFNKGVENE